MDAKARATSAGTLAALAIVFMIAVAWAWSAVTEPFPEAEEQPACIERMCVDAPTAIWRVPLSWLKAMPRASCIRSSSSPSTLAALAAPATKPNSWVANQPSAAVQSGMVFGMAAQVEGIVARMIAALDTGADDVRVIATGYLADIVEGVCDCFTDRSPWLTLLGLELVFQRNT